MPLETGSNFGRELVGTGMVFPVRTLSTSMACFGTLRLRTVVSALVDHHTQLSTQHWEGLMRPHLCGHCCRTLFGDRLLLTSGQQC